ncbi:MAG: hypothetical protein GWP08_17655 [Nitrospiraceae bacterium]|nr:hypothetical protein [Nitrospiraceae bacterium]
MSLQDSFLFRHKKKLIALASPFVLIVAVLAFQIKGPHRFYRVDFVNVGQGEPGMLEVGVAKADITPDLSKYDTYNDVDGDNKYNKDKGDTYNDDNNNGEFDPIWIAGFGSNRPAKGVHDPLWARAIAVRNNGVTVAMVSIDSIGIFHDQFIKIRKAIDPALGVDHVVFSSKHIHEVPDTMGIWSNEFPLPWTLDERYMSLFRRACVSAVTDAVNRLQPAEMFCAERELDPIENFVDDSRKPIVYDRKLACIQFRRPEIGTNIATLVSWGNHPETLGGSNPLLTADFCYWLREGVENGVEDPNGVSGFGGMCLYFQGMVGGLMTQLHTTVPHRNGVDKFRKSDWPKAQALGENLAIEIVKALKDESVWKCENPRVAVAAKTLYAPTSGLFRIGAVLGLIHPGMYWGFKIRTEIDVIRIGDVEILTIPGELYPEIADGGVEAPAGQDFPIAPVEVPPLRAEVMKGKLNMVFGLANDELGYIIPKSQWDTQPPYTYDDPDGPYGEVNSISPDLAPLLHRESVALLGRMHKALEGQ